MSEDSMQAAWVRQLAANELAIAGEELDVVIVGGEEVNGVLTITAEITPKYPLGKIPITLSMDEEAAR